MALVAVVVAAACGRAEPDVPPPTAAAAAVKAAPRWVRVTSRSGTGDGRADGFEISADVLQWRVTATCTTGHLTVTPEGEDKPLVDQACPGPAFGFSIRTGSPTLQVTAGGPWELLVDVQVDTPITEPPLPGMTERNRLASGTFTGIDQQGEGEATLFRLPDGRRALRLEPFFVTPNDDLFVWASEATAPRTSADAFSAPHVQLEALKATAGAQSYVLPDSLALERVHSIVIWCEPVRTAYAAAPLKRR